MTSKLNSTMFYSFMYLVFQEKSWSSFLKMLYRRTSIYNLKPSCSKGLAHVHTCHCEINVFIHFVQHVQSEHFQSIQCFPLRKLWQIINFCTSRPLKGSMW
ncbi:hypothetical protein AMECASPLE_039167 [Ameca splendens]|uniref:Uncharacterized protein n=1 Tax=Ameca splendens TaxID=208324 RepID=A0ABV0XXL5_9TELE